VPRSQPILIEASPVSKAVDPDSAGVGIITEEARERACVARAKVLFLRLALLASERDL
jgi:hypothetical protein